MYDQLDEAGFTGEEFSSTENQSDAIKADLLEF